MRPLYSWVLLVGSALPVLAWPCLAQEFDTVISTQNQKPYTIVDQITDPQERKAFLALYGERDSLERAKLAEIFLATYPQSWLLAQVYEMASKASIDLENYDRALQYGKESLKLLPENPLLLVPIANVQVQQSLLAEAKQSARDALEYLERFARPSAIAEQGWPDLKRQLKASGFFALARAMISEALAAPPSQRRQELLRSSEEPLAQARTLNPLDPESLT
jgi:tetratricopeptide (TPR) repeat protein